MACCTPAPARILVAVLHCYAYAHLAAYTHIGPFDHTHMRRLQPLLLCGEFSMTCYCLVCNNTQTLLCLFTTHTKSVPCHTGYRLPALASLPLNTQSTRFVILNSITLSVDFGSTPMVCVQCPIATISPEFLPFHNCDHQRQLANFVSILQWAPQRFPQSAPTALCSAAAPLSSPKEGDPHDRGRQVLMGCTHSPLMSLCSHII